MRTLGYYTLSFCLFLLGYPYLSFYHQLKPTHELTLPLPLLKDLITITKNRNNLIYTKQFESFDM